ncbi:uncharacterized protein DUF3263 [Nocardia fluminea]|uniref:Uncharacterized protein DUF3263 n=1 Tax=Nocardia fluminea TaxID=134984 RepID=A0A2N3VKD6_9NOCA|nr:uncharacterized protein DUF3263 [Nocardia fluminea]
MPRGPRRPLRGSPNRMSSTTALGDGWVVSPAEIDILEFAAVWAPYGGNDAEAFVQFGLTSEEFHRRLIRLLGSPAARTLTNSTVVTLRRQCLERLYRPTGGSAHPESRIRR